MDRKTNLIFLLLIAPFFLCAQLTDSIFLAQSELELLDAINTDQSEFSPVFCDGGVAYVLFEQKTKNDQPVRGEIKFDLMYFDEALGESRSFSEDINTEFVEGPFTIIENSIYFTRSNSSISNNGQRKLKIFQSTQQEDGSWSSPEMVAFPAGDFNFCHPSLNEAGDVMVFASDLNGGFGKMDLYFSKKIDGLWSRPENLGPLVNGDANEWYPFWAKDKLIYASDSYPQFGGLDLFEISFKNFELRDRKALAAPINSGYDDFGLVIHPDGQQLMFSSARKPRKKDDLYVMDLPESIYKTALPETVILELSIMDEESESPLSDVAIYINAIDLNQIDIDAFSEREILAKTKELSGGTNFKLFSDQRGMQSLNSDASEKYILVLKKDGYREQRFYYNPVSHTNNWIVMMPRSEVYDQFYGKSKEPVIPETRKSKPVITIPMEIGKTIVFKNIYYQYNSASFMQGAQYELDALAEVMLANKNMRVLLTSHTDARGKEKYNLELSEKRAITARSYLVKKGIEFYRVHIEGRGEKEILNHCKNGIDCSEDEHLYNRRTELRILEN